MARHRWYAAALGLLFVALVRGEVRILKGFTLI